MANDEIKTSPVDLVLAMWNRRKWLGLVVLAMPFTALAGIVTFLPNVYQASAKVLVESQQVPESFVKSTVTSDLQSRLQTINQEVLSRTRLEEMISRFGLYPELRQRASLQAAVNRMRDDIKLEFVAAGQGRLAGRGGTTVAFTIAFRGRDPQTVALVANALASFYIEENLKVRERQASGTAEFLKVQLEDTKKRLDEQERRVSEFKKRYVGELAEHTPTNLATLERLNAQFRINSDNQTRSLERREALVKQLADAGIFGVAGAPDAAAARLAKLKQDLTELRTRFSDKYPEVVRVRAEIAILEEQLAKPEARPDTEPLAGSPHVLRLKQTIGEIEGDLKAFKTEERHLRAAIATYQTRVENAPRREQELEELSRGYETTKQLHRTLLNRYEEAQLAESMEQRQKGEQFRVVDAAMPPGSPAAPRRAQLLLVGLVLCLGLAGGTVMLLEQVDTSFHSAEELQAFTRVPVLLSVPRILVEDVEARRKRRVRVAVGMAVVGLLAIFGVSYVVGHGNEQLLWMLPGNS